jgi:hypothetical protein
VEREELSHCRLRCRVRHHRHRGVDDHDTADEASA